MTEVVQDPEKRPAPSQALPRGERAAAGLAALDRPIRLTRSRFDRTTCGRSTALCSVRRDGAGDTFSYTFDAPGTYRYQCTFHHPNMNGMVIVEDG